MKRKEKQKGYFSVYCIYCIVYKESENEQVYSDINEVSFSLVHQCKSVLLPKKGLVCASE